MPVRSARCDYPEIPVLPRPNTSLLMWVIWWRVQWRVPLIEEWSPRVAGGFHSLIETWEKTLELFPAVLSTRNVEPLSGHVIWRLWEWAVSWTYLLGTFVPHRGAQAQGSALETFRMSRLGNPFVACGSLRAEVDQDLGNIGRGGASLELDPRAWSIGDPHGPGESSACLDRCVVPLAEICPRAIPG